MKNTIDLPASILRRRGILMRYYSVKLSLSAMEFESAAYGLAWKTQLKKLDSTHNNGLRIALGAFCINRTQNLLIEAGEATLQQSREIKIANMVVEKMVKPEHPINRYLRNKKMYDQYGKRSSLTFPFLVRAKEACFQLKVDLRDVDQMAQLKYRHNSASSLQRIQHPKNKSWTGNNLEYELPELHPDIYGRKWKER
jgi:hypothetical protein